MLFGEQPIDTVELAKFVIEQFEKLPGGRIKTAQSKPWTQAIYSGLSELAQSKGLLVSYENPLDVIWRLPPPRCDIVLGVECEWNYCNDVLFDFEKLMHIKSPLKLMICSVTRGGGPNSNNTVMLERLRKEYLAPFGQHIRGETYLLVNFFGSTRGGWTADADCYQFVVPEDGKIETASFAPLVLAKTATP